MFLDHIFPDIFQTVGQQVAGPDLHHGEATDLAPAMHFDSGSGAGDQDTGGEMGVGLQLQGIFDGVLGTAGCFTGAITKPPWGMVL